MVHPLTRLRRELSQRASLLCNRTHKESALSKASHPGGGGRRSLTERVFIIFILYLLQLQLVSIRKRKQLAHSLFSPRQMQVAEECLHTGRRAVFRHGCRLWRVGVTDIASSVKDGVLLLGKMRQKLLHRLGLHRRTNEIERFFVQPCRRGKSALDQMLAHEKLDDHVTEIRQRRRRGRVELIVHFKLP